VLAGGEALARNKRSRYCLFVSFTIGCITGALLVAGRLGAAETNSSRQQLERLAGWLKSPDEGEREDAIRELADMHSPEAFALMRQGLQDTNAAIRADAAWSLCLSPSNPETISALRKVLADYNDRVRASAIWTLSHIGGKAVLPDVVQLATNDVSGVVRFRAVWGLAFIRDKSALPVAITALGDYNNAVRERSALLAIDALTDKSSVIPLLLTQRHNILPATRRVVMYLLAKYGDGSAVPALTDGLNDSDALVRGEAAISLGKLRARKALAALQPALQDPDDHVRGSAAYGVGLMGDPGGMALLRPLLKDDSALVRAVAADSLHTLGDRTAKPPEGFKSSQLFTYPIFSPEQKDLY
jgi:HEAT repeat protein